ncbi:hypothetical protein [Brevibacillus migulae]|uniref:hypothetical protein n=1 Tax=Brevibacillus migulae TaxID=1644114 RepID=UPI00106E1F1C|nr:hypothetical protein [Brevibacillus migulae]
MNTFFRHEVQTRLVEKPECSPVFTSTLRIPERLREYDPNLFILFNNKTERFEIHSLTDRSLIGGTVLPYKSLDARTLDYVKRNDIRARGEAIFKELEEHERKMEKQRKRDFSNWVEAVGKETRKEFALSSLGLDHMKTVY